MSERDLEQRAAQQHGVFSIAQARDAGLSENQIYHHLRTTSWVRVRTGVFRGAGTPETWRGMLLAECLALGAESLVSHRAAGRLWKLAGLTEQPIELTVASNRFGSTRTALVHRCKLLVPEDRRTIDDIPVTGPELTLLQLAGVCHRWRLDGLVDDAIRRDLTSLPKLRWRLRVLGRRGRNGSGVLRSVLDARDPETAAAQSTLERKFFELTRAAKVPKPVLQHRVVSADGRFLAYLDAAWPAARVGVELDSAEFHRPIARWTRDLERQTELQAMGWKILRFTWWQVHDRQAWVRAKLLQTIRASEQ